MRRLCLTLITLGTALLLAAGLVVLGFARQDHSARLRAEALLRLAAAPAGEPAAGEGAAGREGAAETAPAGGGEAALGREDIYAVVEIPALELTLPVLDRYSEALLKTAPCRYPGPEGTADPRPVVAGHNYASHFKGIAALAAGAEVRLTAPGAAAQAYTVTAVEEIAGDDFAGLYAGSWDLTLFTCNFLGDKRILVRCALAA